MSEHKQFEEECGCGHHHGEDEGCGCEHHHENGEGCGCEHHHEDGEGCGCEHHHEDGEGCGCGHHHGSQQAQQAPDAPYVIQGQMLGTSAVATSTVTVMAKYSEVEAKTKEELQGLADWVIGRNGSISQMKSALVAIHSTMIAMTEDGKNMDTVVPEKEEIRVQLVAMVNDIPLEDLKAKLKEICERTMNAAQ